MFLENKYTKLYFSIISKPREKISGYSEKHHIIPRCMGGVNTINNLVLLSAREHYLVHLLLTKMTEGVNRKKMAFALSMFNTGCRNHTRVKPNSRWYEYSRRLLSEVLTGRVINQKTRDAVSKARLGIPLSDEHKRKLSETLSKKIAYYAVSPANEHLRGDDLKSFCSAQNISYHTVVKRIKNPCIITAGKHRGWIFSLTEIIHPDNLRNSAMALASRNRGNAVKAQWRDNTPRKTQQKNRTRMHVVLRNPMGELIEFESLTSVAVFGPVSTIQTAKINVPFKYGVWAGWARLK